MSTFDFDEAVEHYHRAAGEFVKGNPEPYKMVFSHREESASLTPLALSCVGGSRLLRPWSVPHRCTEMARSPASRT